ncbi:unnamed protein product [Ixodes hexagonus]
MPTAAENPLEPTGNSTLPATDNSHLARIIENNDEEIGRLRDECGLLRHQLVMARETIREMQAEKISLDCQLAEEKKILLHLPSNDSRTVTKTLCSTPAFQVYKTLLNCFST